MLLNETQIKKNRTKGTAFMILDLMKNLDLTSLMSNIFIYTEDPIAKELIKRYELKLIEAYEDKDTFSRTLHSFYLDMNKYIKKNQLYREFYSFCYFVFSNLTHKRLEKSPDSTMNDALNCYYNLLFQQMNYFTPHPKMVYGLESNGKLLLRNEPFPNLDTILMEEEIKGRHLTKETLYKKYQKMGYDIRSDFDFNKYHSNDQLLTNMTLVMTYFINEKTIQVKPKEFYMVAGGIDILKPTVPTETYKNLLKEKRYFLPIKGVIGQYEHCKNIKEVFFQEVFTDNRVILLYKVTTVTGGEFCGFYDNKLDVFYSPWDSTDFGTIFHKEMENFILENYCYLTTDIDEKMSEMKLNKRLYLKNTVPVLALKPLPTVSYLYEIKNEKKQSDKKNEKQLRTFDKRNYQESKITIHPFVRRLPAGATASEEAIKLAKEYHYVLSEGETFVRPFERKSYKKE